MDSKIKNQKDLMKEEEALFNDLVKLRQDISEKAGVVPRGIISDMVLRKIAETKPKEEADLRKLPGVSQLFIERYGKVFVGEINGNNKSHLRLQKLSKVARDVYEYIEKGLSIDDVAKKLYINDKMVANYVLESVKLNLITEPNLFVSEEEYNRVKDYVSKNYRKTFDESFEEIGNELSNPIFKIVYAMAKKELGL